MRILAILFLITGCAPEFDQVGNQVMRAGGCVKFKCELPLSDCRLRPGTCR
jgi:hypothetical protein